MGLRVKKRHPVAMSRPHYTLPQRTLKRQQRRQTIRRTITAMLVVAVLAILGASAYTWYVGQQAPIAQSTEDTPFVPKRANITPPKIASNAPIGVAVQTYTPEVKPGENASVTVRTNPEAQCAIVVKYDEVQAQDSGLAPKVSDEFGLASWSWTVKVGTPAGEWPAEITCKNKKNSAFVKADIVVL